MTEWCQDDRGQRLALIQDGMNRRADNDAG